jgi:hypothetical protein
MSEERQKADFAKWTKILLVVIAAYIGYGFGLERGRSENHKYCIQEVASEGE